MSMQVSESAQKTISGIGWSVASKFIRQFAQLIFQIILARILSPADFGLIGMVMVFTTFAEIVRNMGLGAALIQKLHPTQAHYSAAFYVNISLGFFLNIIFQLAAPLISSFYNQPMLENILRVYSFIFLIGSFNIVQEAQMQRNLQFKRLFIMDAISVTISGIVAILMAVNGWGVWALVWQYLLISFISSLILWITSSWRPSLDFSLKGFSELRKYGTNLIGHELLNFAARNFDNLLVGKYLGPAALGIYSRAYFLMLQPVNLTNQVLARVMFPILSAAQQDIVRIKRMYLKSTRLIAFIIFPLIGYIFISAEPLITIILGSKWLAVAPLLQIFCLYCAIDTIGISTTWIYKSLGHTTLLFKWGIYSTTVIIIAIIIGLQWGITGVAWAYSISFSVFLWIPGWYIAFRLIGLSVSNMLYNIAPSFLSSVLTIGILYLLKSRLFVIDHPFLLAGSLLLAATVIYLMLSLYINRETFFYFKKLAFHQLNRVTRKKIK